MEAQHDKIYPQVSGVETHIQSHTNMFKSHLIKISFFLARNTAKQENEASLSIGTQAVGLRELKIKLLQ